jgi:outer membrane protein
MRQPLYDRGRDAQQQQFLVLAQSSEIESDVALQEWMLQTAQRYFEIVLAERRFELVQRQLAAVDRAFAEARDRYALGDTPVTDTHEALARQRNLVAQARALDNDRTLARAALADSTGLAQSSLQPRSPRADIVSSLPDLEIWLQRAADRNPGLLAQQARVEIASLEARKQAAGSSATVELVAQAMQDRVSGRGDFGAGGSTQRQQSIGVTLQIPLYSGGMSQARETEALRHEDRERATLAMRKMQVAQQVRATWLGLISGQERLAALGDARVASQSRLDATRLGRQVGDRTTLDLLAAESDADAADLALLQARVDQIMGELRLHALAGELDADALARVDGRLER